MMHPLIEQLRRIMRKNEETAELLDRLEWRLTKQSDLLATKRMIIRDGKEILV